jgi:hypothetical protein
MKKAFAVVALLSTVCQGATVPDSLLACRKVTNEAERVRCYDTQIDKMSAPTPAVIRSTPMEPAAKFGKETLPMAARPKAAPPEEVALDSTIQSLKKVARSKYTITLANGQVWQQEEASDTALFFKVGDGVRIEKSSLGSYHMSTSATGSKNWIRVTRLQ